MVEPPVYHCPYCGASAPVDHWWTQDQIDYARELAAGSITHDIVDGLKKSMSRSRKSFLNFSVEYDDSGMSHALHEPNDMVAVASPCHAWEPIKVDEEWEQGFHCLVCGSRFGI
jgi:hypothetical protein